MKKIVKIIISIIVFFILCTKIVALIYPIDIVNVECNDITEELDDYHLYDNMNLTDKIKNNAPYLVVYYEINLKNNNSNEIFIEWYKHKIPFSYIYFEDRVEFNSQCELKPNKKSYLGGIYVIDLKNMKKEDIIRQIEKKAKFKVCYWVFLKKLPLLAWK